MKLKAQISEEVKRMFKIFENLEVLFRSKIYFSKINKK